MFKHYRFLLNKNWPKKNKELFLTYSDEELYDIAFKDRDSLDVEAIKKAHGQTETPTEEVEEAEPQPTVTDEVKAEEDDKDKVEVEETGPAKDGDDAIQVEPTVGQVEPSVQVEDVTDEILGVQEPISVEEEKTEEESAKLKAQRPLGSGDPYFGGSGHRFTIRNGAEELMLNLAPEHCGQLPSNFLGRDHWFGPQGLTS